MTKKTTLSLFAKQTLEACKQGYYFNSQNEKIAIAQALATAQQNTIHYRPEDFTQVFVQRNQVLASKVTKQTTDFEVVNSTTLQACQKLLQAGLGKVYALNFASAKNPGGGFLGGAQAQEESLARAGGLYPCLLKAPGYYETHRALNTCLYTDNMIYSPDVPIFRAEDGGWLPDYYKVSFVTSPAVNQNGMNAKHEKPAAFAQIPAIMRARTEKILSLAVVHQYEALVLGAWGCGVFQNQPTEVATYFGEFLLQGAFRNVFRKVVFAVLDSSQDEKFIRPFQEKFTP
ncbi:MAG: TIGR02452 family protein [Microscillaceae bacterium]|jgi:uncharacterized protein (TIGR02452 family)|nr:TIGR02452 family protein [Microscillaceae bacterium]